MPIAAINISAKAYESWLKTAIGPDFVDADLDEKHRKMRASAFGFLRATYWRWAEIILDICQDLSDSPEILAIGDTHLENFGTWRDAEGRLVWGVNDFDDAAIMPYPLDLVRLAASALLAGDDAGPSVDDICDAILGGYEAGLSGPTPLVIERDYKWLRKAILLPEPERAAFWDKFDRIKTTATGSVPLRYRNALRAAMPDPDGSPVIAPRAVGTGSLGRPRFVARDDWKGGPVLREAKALVISAWSLRFNPGTTTILAGEIASGRFRAPDPHYHVTDGILVRRLSPNSRKIEANDADATLLSRGMLEMMGREIANCHADDPAGLAAVRGDFPRRKKGWLRRAAKAAAQTIVQEQAQFI